MSDIGACTDNSMPLCPITVQGHKRTWDNDLFFFSQYDSYYSNTGSGLSSIRFHKITEPDLYLIYFVSNKSSKLRSIVNTNLCLFLFCVRNWIHKWNQMLLDRWHITYLDVTYKVLFRQGVLGITQIDLEVSLSLPPR